MKYWIPSFVTVLNLFCGCLACIAALTDNINVTAILVFIALILDFLDGFLARKLGAESEFGKQLDSLADLITFGLVPGIIVFKMFLNTNSNTNEILFSDWDIDFLPLTAFLITISSAIRLANFNIDINQKNSFLGLPTPANTLFIVSLPLIKTYQGSPIIFELLTEELVLFIITMISSFLLNMPIPLLAIKFKNNSWQDNKYQIVFLIISFILLIALKFLAVPLIIITYIILSIVKFTSKQNLTLL